LVEPYRLKAVANLQKYQEEIKAWRDPNVKLWELEIGDLVLLRSPYTESTGKQEAKWAGPYVIVKKMSLGAYHLSHPEVRVLEHSWNADSLRHFFI
jgi:hypothetical protein